jgi:hypothetical protein
MADAQELAEPTKSPISKVELERLLLDAVRRGIEDDHPPTLWPTTNDNQPAWPLIPFPERWSGT